MSKTEWTPGIVPYGADQTAYLVIDRRGGSGNARNVEVERADLEAVIADLMSGQFDDPRQVVAFNTLEHWSEDISEQIALEIQSRCDIAGERIPEHIRDFTEHFTRPTEARTAFASRTRDRTLACALLT